MRIRLSDFLSSLLVASLLAVTPAWANNLLLNEGFEEVADGKPVAWEEKLSTEKEGDGVATKGEVRLDEEHVRSGKHSLYLRSEGPRWVSAKQEVKLEPGVKYRLKAYALTTGKDHFVSIAVRGSRRGTEEKFVISERLPEGTFTDWTPIEVEFVAPEDLAGASVWLRVLFDKAPREAWFDDVTLERVE